MSSKIDPNVLVERNRFSILLSLLRRKLTSADYCGLLRMQSLSDQRLRHSLWSPQACTLWRQELQRELDAAFGGLEAGAFHRRHLHRIAHLYRDLFLFH